MQAVNLFALLRHQSAQHPLAIATHSARRDISYRRLWSRIERATARLQGEWHVGPGDTVAYWGNAHPDALILYVAVARCGARLLPLERAEVRSRSAAVWKRYPPKAVVHDDGLLVDALFTAPVITSLPSVLSVRCHHAAEVDENADLPSLIELRCESGQLLERVHSVHQLYTPASSVTPQPVRVSEVLFDAEQLSSRIFPALARGEIVSFS